MSYFIVPVLLLIGVLYIIILTQNKKEKEGVTDLETLKLISGDIDGVISENGIKMMMVLVQAIEKKNEGNFEYIVPIDEIKNKLHERKVVIVGNYNKNNEDIEESLPE